MLLLDAGLDEVMARMGDGVPRKEMRRRKLEKFCDRDGGGEDGGESGVMSTDNVGENDTGENSGAQSIRTVGEGFFGGIAGASVPFDAAIAIGLLGFISISREGCCSERVGIFVVGRYVSD